MSSGTLYQLLARVVFVFSSYGLHIILAYFIYDLQEYGRIGIIFSMLAISRVLLTSGVPQAISRFVAASPTEADGIFRQGIKIQAAMALLIWGIYGGGVVLWSGILGDEKLFSLILLSSLTIPATALYQSFQGILAGHRLFFAQSMALTVYSCARLIFATSLVALGYGAYGAVTGIFLALLAGIYFSWRKLPKISSGSYHAVKPILAFAVPIILCSLGITSVLHIDLLMLKHFYPDSQVVGSYSGAMNIGKLPYFILIGFSTVILPTLAQKISVDNMDGALDTVRSELGFLVAIIALGSAITLAASYEILDFIYPQTFTSASTYLPVIFIASCCMALVQSFIAVLGALDRVKHAFIVLAGTLIIQVSLNSHIIPLYGPVGAAYSNLCGALFAVAVIYLMICKFWFNPLPPVFCLQAVVLSIVPYLVMKYLPFKTLGLLPLKCFIASIIYMGLLYMVNRDFAKKFKALINRNKKNSELSR